MNENDDVKTKHRVYGTFYIPLGKLKQEKWRPQPIYPADAPAAARRRKNTIGKQE